MMANDIRPEVSQKNPYWIGKHRYYELKHFCLQYPTPIIPTVQGKNQMLPLRQRRNWIR